MATDPRVDLVFSHNTPRYEGTGVDPNDLRELMKRIDRREDWCRVWSAEGARHEAMARECPTGANCQLPAASGCTGTSRAMQLSEKGSEV